MIARTIAACARRPGPVIVVALLAALLAARGWRGLARDAIPDLADPRIALVAEWMGHGALDVAEQVTRPLTARLEGIAGAVAVRGTSMSGMTYVEVVFASPRQLGAGRAELNRRVDSIRSALPASVRVHIGPEASATGWVFQYALIVTGMEHPIHVGGERTSRESPYQLRRFQDDVLRPALAAVPGVAEVASAGGEGEQLLVEARPARLRDERAAFSDVVAAVRAALAASPDATIADVARAADPALAGVRLAGDMPSGVVDFNGFTRAVGGIVIARPGADVAAVIAGVKRVLEQQKQRLPRGIALAVAYDRSELIEGIERTELRALAEEVAAVAIVVLFFLAHGRSALLPLLTLPLVVLLAFGAMWLLRVPITVMSLSGIGIALGMAIDADIVALEACHRRLELEPAGPNPRGQELRGAIAAAGGSFGPAVVTSLIIAAISFLPVFAFTGETGRLLRPLALSKTLVFAAAAVVAVTVAPALRDRLLARRGRIVPEMANPVTRRLVSLYRPFVHFALRWPAFTLVTAALAVASSVPIIAHIKSEFLPRIDEGDLLYMPTTAPGVPPHEAAMDLGHQDKIIASPRVVASVFGKVGRADTATDPAPYSMAETTIRLAPRAERPGTSPATVARTLDGMSRLPGWTNAWTAPIRARMDMLSTGVKTPVGVRVVAADPSRVRALAAAVRASLSPLAGTRSAVGESLDDEPRLAFQPDAAAIAEHRVDAALVSATADLIISGGEVGALTIDKRRVPVRLVPDAVPQRPEQTRRTDETLGEATVRSTGASPDGGGGVPIALALLGRVTRVREPAVVRAERGELVGYVHVDVDDGTDLADYVARGRRQVESDLASLRLPGERIEWVGQHELWAAGQRRLLLIAPIVLLSMLALLYFQFRNVTEALIVLSSVPFALVGSFWTLFLLDYRMSAPVWVGLLSVVGLAMQMGVVMVVYIDEAFFRRVREGKLASRDDIIAAHADGTVLRLRPKLMTVVTMAVALAPLLWAQGAGAEIMKRVAAPMLGGLATSAFLTLEVLPVLYTLWRYRQLRRALRTNTPIADVVGPPPSWAR